MWVLFELLTLLPISSGMIPQLPDVPSPPPTGSPERPAPPDGLESNGIPPDQAPKTRGFMPPDAYMLPVMPMDDYPMHSSGFPDNSDGYPTQMDGEPMAWIGQTKQLAFPMPLEPMPIGPGPVPPANLNMTQGSRAGNLTLAGQPMMPDTSYCDMLLQSPLPASMNDVPWFCMCTLCKGNNIGPKGDRGDRGLPGLPGSPGRRGLTGFSGRPGFIGHQGQKGQKGDEGMKGEKGAVGFSGNKGSQGLKGDKGDQGLDGTPGPQGPQGDAGVCPQSCESIPGRPGGPGLPGSTGARGLPGVNGSQGPKGLKGDMGSMGPPGVPGDVGKKGDQGVKGVCNCSNGADGANGLPGPMGPKGDKGMAGPPGVSGSNGTKGDKGDVGVRGVPGPCSPVIQSAFSAALTSNYPPPNLPVVFANVLYNYPQNYNPTRGIYFAPINGTYVFSYNLKAFGRVLKVGLFLNFLPIVKTTELTDMGTASQQVVLHLNMGDMVWIQVKDATTNGMYASSECSSTFTGFLLYPDSCDLPLFREFVPLITGTYSWGELAVPATPPTHMH